MGKHHTKMVLDLFAGLQEVLQQVQPHMETLTNAQRHVDHVSNAVQNTQQ